MKCNKTNAKKFHRVLTQRDADAQLCLPLKLTSINLNWLELRRPVCVGAFLPTLTREIFFIVFSQVLDLSQNRIRELKRQSFESLTDLHYLYIFDNMINRIEDDTFARLTNLEALDLSGNGLLDVPPEIFNLPMLRNLYIADNSFTDRGFDTIQKVAKPIKAPLKILNIANNRLFKIPDFGVLPELHTLNISSNSMRELTPQQFSPFCNIKEIDMNNTAMEKCRCEEVTRFLYKKRDAYLLSSFYCDAISSGKNSIRIIFHLKTFIFF